MDLNHDNKLDFKEFLSISVDRDQILTEKNLSTFFKQLDTDNDGVLSAEEICDGLMNFSEN